MSSASTRFSSRSIATRVMYGTAVVALLAFGVAAAASYLRSSQSCWPARVPRWRDWPAWKPSALPAS